MRMLPLVSITIALLGVTACSYEKTSAYTSDVQIAAAPIVDLDTPVLGARDGDPATLNSDNQPLMSHTGLNSSPNNPDGVPRPGAMNPYGG